MATRRVIDAHQHFWQLARGDFAWPNASVPQIFRDFGPEDLKPLLEAAGVSHTVLVQATDSLAETDYLLDLVEALPWVLAVVGWVDLAAPDAIATIDRLRQAPKFKGLRPMLQSIDETGWINRAAVQPVLAHVAQSGLCFDALIQPRHLPAILTLAQAHPDLSIVIDHCAKPAMGQGRRPDADWLEGMAALAKQPNVYCKLSGLLTEIGPDWAPADLSRFAAHVMQVFGPDRVLWGSDWPVVNLAGGYAAWMAQARALTADLSPAQQDALFCSTAQRVYRLD